MTDRQTNAVAEALYSAYVKETECEDESWEDAPKFVNEHYIEMAQAAIAASDARYVPVLVEAMEIIESATYPTTVFQPLTKNDWLALHAFCAERGFTIDRISGEYGRMFTATTSDIARRTLAKLPEEYRG